jgi:hypothetical protein
VYNQSGRFLCRIEKFLGVVYFRISIEWNPSINIVKKLKFVECFLLTLHDLTASSLDPAASVSANSFCAFDAKPQNHPRLKQKGNHIKYLL